MMSWMNPQQYQMWASRVAAPTGWAGSWPPQAPRGNPGPPPPPPGVDPTVWYGGQWQFNPMYQGPMSAAAPMQAWAPHPSWGPAVAGAAAGAGAAGFNPYKRVPNRGDAEYWNTKLSDNPLGLENMITSEELWKREEDKAKQQQPSEAPQTPWLWVPKELSKSDERSDHRSNTRDGRGPEDLQKSQRPHEHHQRHHHHPSHANKTSSSNVPQQPPDRPPATPAPPSAQQYGSQGPTQAPYPFYHDRNGNYIRARADSTAPRSTGTPVPTSSSQSQQPRVTSPVPTTQRSTRITSASEQARQREAERAFSSQKQLQPTFSPKIVRTPQHYVGAPPGPTDPRSSRRLTRGDTLIISTSRERSQSRYRGADNRDDDDSPPPTRDHKHGPIYGPATPTPGLSRSSSQVIPPSIRRATSPSRQASLPSLNSSISTLSISAETSSQPSSLLLSGFTDEPTGMLSPLIVNAPAPSPNAPKEVSRSHTYPAVSAPPTTRTFSGRSDESSPSSRSSKTPRPSPGKTPTSVPRTPKTPKTPGSVSRSRTYPSLDDDIPPVIPPMPSPPRSRAASPPRSATGARNPLPNPPMPSTYHVSSASAAARSQSHSQIPTQPQSQSQSQPYPHSRTMSHSQPSQTSSSTVRTVSASSAAAAAAAARSSYGGSTPAPPPVIPPRKVRYGFWNKRGDHLVVLPPSPKSSSPISPTVYSRSKMYIVYAPHSRANPEDLRDYPMPTDGWMDHRGRMIKYDGSVPELPDSLPLHGEPPLRPYETFVHYVDAQYR